MLPQAPLRLIMQATTLLLCSLNFAFAAEPPSEPILRIDPGEHTGAINRIATDAAGRWLVTASNDKTARVWNLADGHLLNTLRIPFGTDAEGKLYAVALSPEGQTIALGGWTQFNNGSESVDREGMNIFLFDRSSGRMLRRLTGLSNAVLHLAFSPDGNTLAATLGGKNGLRLFSVTDGHLIAEDRDYGSDSNSVHFSLNGHTGNASDRRLVTTSDDGLLRLYRFDGQTLSLVAKRAAPGGKHPFAARFSPDGRSIAVGFRDTLVVNVLEARNLALDYVPDTTWVNAALANIAWSQDGLTLHAAGQALKQVDSRSQQYIRSWSNAGKGAHVDWPVAGNTIFDLQALPGGRLAFGSGEPAWGMVNQSGLRTLSHVSVVADFRAILQGFTLGGFKVQVQQC